MKPIGEREHIMWLLHSKASPMLCLMVEVILSHIERTEPNRIFGANKFVLFFFFDMSALNYLICL